MLRDREWKFKYSTEDGNLVHLFYVPALESAHLYDRLTGYFSAKALELAARGIEALVNNGGRMRLIVGCTLDPREIAAIRKGEDLRSHVERRMQRFPLAAEDKDTVNAIELLVWMIAQGYLEVKVAVPCDASRRPVPNDAIFHEKVGIVRDGAGDRLAWNGSLNETAAGWTQNWESINVFTSWRGDLRRVEEEEDGFKKLWSNERDRAIVLDIPEAVRQDMMRFLPRDRVPDRLRDKGIEPAPNGEDSAEAWKDRVWSFIRRAPEMAGGGAFVGEATCAITPWPHQARAFERMYTGWPPRLLIADEVGLGKTIQAGLLLRQAWLAGKARRILILAPKAVLFQWQVELREKFNLDWPIYDGRQLVWYRSGLQDVVRSRVVQRESWHLEPVVLASSHLFRRKDRAREVCEEAEPWDLVVLDEAHHARRRGAGSGREGGPNNLLSLMRRLKSKCEGLVLLTATPMQVAPVEVWDLLELLGLPQEWSEQAFLAFFENIGRPAPAPEVIRKMARLFQAVEKSYGEVDENSARRTSKLSPLRTDAVLRALRDRSTIPIRKLDPEGREAAIRIMRANSPISRLVSRHTRELLREYHRKGKLATRIGDRRVSDKFIRMSPEEWRVYKAVDDYIRSTYRQASAQKKSAVGFAMVIYRRRLASSFHALRRTLEKRLHALDSGDARALGQDEDIPDDEVLDDVLLAEDVGAWENESLAFEERAQIENLLEQIGALSPDTKANVLVEEITALRAAGYSQVMVFTQFTDTIDFLRSELLALGGLNVICFSGRGGEVSDAGGAWLQVSRDDVKERFRTGKADVMLCSEAAAEGLNFQFCGALINYDMPWNPMRVEQRIGRIDRLGQQHREMQIINLHYANTVETDVYLALRGRIKLFEQLIGSLQPILSKLAGRIGEAILRGEQSSVVLSAITDEVEECRDEGLNMDAVTEDDFEMPVEVPSPVTMEDLDRIIRTPELMHPRAKVEPLGPREYKMLGPASKEFRRVTSNPEYFEKHADSVELWSPGSPVFQPPEYEDSSDFSAESLSEILDQYENVASRRVRG